MEHDRLVIAEKPSVAQSIAAVIGATKRQNGYLEGGGYRVSWCLGHLAGLASAETYDERYSKWKYEDLPILPQPFQYVPNKDKLEQFRVLKELMNAPEVTEVVNACDAGREGEAIFRQVYDLAQCKKPILRLWISSMEDEAIQNGFRALRPGEDYDRLYQAALCRMQADWLVGINATRLFSVLYHKKLNIGRVMSPTLALLVQREAEIASFQPMPFYNVILELPDLILSGERMEELAAAEALQRACTGATAIIQQVEQREKVENPPTLYDLTTLQREANRMHGFTAQQTLDYLQSLYEKKLCTYPRTDSRYLTADLAERLPELVNQTSATMPFGEDMEKICNAEQVIDDKKVTDHHAIIPTMNLSSTDLKTLPAGEQTILRMVALRLLCAVGQPCRYTETIIHAQCTGQSFAAKGRTVLETGWKKWEKLMAEEEKVGAQIPLCTERQSMPIVSAKIKKGKTTAPKHYTEDSLLSAMEHAGIPDMPEDGERKGLGTPATRAGILEKLVSVGFVERRKVKKAVHLIPTQNATALITVLPEQLQSPLLTAEWECRLQEVELGELTAADFMAEISDMVRELVRTYQVIPDAGILFQSDKVGKCPRCGGNVTENSYGFFCRGKNCTFALWKNNRFFASKKKPLNRATVEALLKEGKISLRGCCSPKTAKTYDATFVLQDDGDQISFETWFEDKHTTKRTIKKGEIDQFV